LARRQEDLTILFDDVDLDRDRALVERCQAGDSAAFGTLYGRYYERLLRFCLRRLNDRHEAEDAAQEAFARAWKALPRLAGERRFYPWLTVIAANICTDVLRRRARSTPTDDLELTARQPVGIVEEDTSEELVLAAVDGELVNRALGRLSERHRHVLAMREGSGWTYQQIAEHEGVRIGTIETLLWRARQALKREFALLSESKEALGGFLIATGALIRRTVFRAAHRGASVPSQRSGATAGGLRNAFTGAAVAGAAVAAAFVAPHTLFASSHVGTVGGTSADAVMADPPLALDVAVPTPAKATTASSHTTQAGTTGSAGGSGGSGDRGYAAGVAGGGTTAGSGGGGTTGSGMPGGTSGPIGGSPDGGTVKQAGRGLQNVAQGLGNTVTTVVGGLHSAVSGVANGGGSAVSGVTGALSNATHNVTSGVSNTMGGVVGGVSTSVSGLLGGAGVGSGSTPAAGTSSTTTTTTAPGLLGGAANLLGGN
jgi:RNA polymerase sigma-70 factor (ECF subfamily)